ncbi:hypothetical protein NQ314_003782 [Rhamnusium bicolor]|uniref:Pop1 N-terminal domain-containing protein n=1 Tax=Rhamnusium bicolor TaxID=1586634 RepID=A0AAV8ZMU3_9CUCU|nr:hypothetical protein NQ314_003782 [Rhamnusium bicolor]
MSESWPDCNAEKGQQLPQSITISKFSAARGKEIQIMRKSLSSTTGTKLAFQKLSTHMRRRAMSHNVKRLPRRLREIHLNQMKKSGIPPKQKRPSRKYRRRPYNLLSDYMRRQRRHRWLDTHIWHAKRFRMIEKWGYKLPLRPCDRAFRACYRATVNHCLLQDISYYNCVEIKGNYNIIVSNFKEITDPNIGLTIAAKSFAKGSREGKITLFRSDGSKKAIGIIYFHWKPSQTDNKHVLWIWIHAAYYTETLNTLINCFKLELSYETSYVSKDNIELKELKLELNRFRLTGSLSNAVLQNCFQITKDKKCTEKWEKKCEMVTDNSHLQKEYWSNLKNTSSTTGLPRILFCH